MNPQLLNYYNRELAYLRELGGEFAEEYPKIASRLSLRGLEVADPYVERLLEGFSFLAARIHLKMDAEFPRFSQRLLEVTNPSYLSPTPAMGVVQMHPETVETNLQDGYFLPRLSRLRSALPHGETTACEFRTAHDMTLWPLASTHAGLGPAPSDITFSNFPTTRPVRGHLRLIVELAGKTTLDRLPIDRLEYFIQGTPEIASHLQELIHVHACGIVIHDPDHLSRPAAFLPSSTLSPEGFSNDQALLPYDSRGFQGHRLLHEYFAFPERFQFFSITGLRPVIARFAGARRLAISILLDTVRGDMETRVDKGNFLLNCVPIINLFPRTSDRIKVARNRHEYHLVIDRTKPRDYEVYRVDGVLGHREGETEARSFRPLYSSIHGDHDTERAYFSVRREPRLLSEKALRDGPRTGYIGSEVFVSMVDQAEAPFSDNLRQITVDTLCTNRDLTRIMPVGSDSDLSLIDSAPVARIKLVAGLTDPMPAIAENQLTWRLISQLSLNYLTLTDLSPEEGAATLRDLLSLYASLGRAGAQKQAAALQSAQIAQITRRYPRPGPLVFARGVGIELKVDELLFSGVSPWALGQVLEQFLARHVAINTFTEMRLSSLQRGEIARWSPRPGRRPIA